MKRSEFLLELKSLLYESDAISIPNSSYLDEDALAKEIMKLIDEKKLVPMWEPEDESN